MCKYGVYKFYYHKLDIKPLPKKINFANKFRIVDGIVPIISVMDYLFVRCRKVASGVWDEQ